MSRYDRKVVAIAPQITPAVRLAWARTSLEEAAGRLANDRQRSRVFVEAVVARYREVVVLEIIAEASRNAGRGTRAIP